LKMVETQSQDSAGRSSCQQPDGICELHGSISFL
jgi:hypothetical protein